jgi:hypothetical protein
MDIKLISDWGFKILTLIGLILIMFLNHNYVTRTEYMKDLERITGIEKVLVRLEEKLEHDKDQDLSLRDHELRLRELEKGK